MKALAVAAGISVPLILGGSASGGFVGITTESKPNGFGLLTVNVYAVFDRPGEDHMLAVGGTTLTQLTIGSMAAPAGATCPLPACTIDFDFVCPDAMAVCGASFTGGITCVFEFLKFCYSTGLFSYRVDPGFPLTITLSGDLVDIEVFFANVTGSSGEMRFFNADDQEVGTPFQTNGNCLVVMPAAQSQVFNEPVRRIEVTASGVGPVYIDTFRVNPAFVPPPGDLDGDCSVGVVDFLMLLAAWGPCPVPCPPFCPGDLDGDCNVGIIDFLMLLANWG